jgi:hypothetical protein
LQDHQQLLKLLLQRRPLNIRSLLTTKVKLLLRCA